MLEVRTASPPDYADVVRVMASAFDDDPVSRWLVPVGRSLAPLFRAHVRTGNAGPQHIDLALLDGEAVGVAVWHEPGYRVSTWRQLASIPWYAVALGRHLQRGATLEGLMHRARPHEEFWYLAGIGASGGGRGSAPRCSATGSTGSAGRRTSRAASGRTSPSTNASASSSATRCSSPTARSSGRCGAAADPQIRVVRSTG